MSFVGVCGHGKRLYPSRKLARKEARRAHGHHLREYRCTDVEGYWHIGHTPHDVIRGNMTTREIFGAAEPAVDEDVGTEVDQSGDGGVGPSEGDED